MRNHYTKVQPLIKAKLLYQEPVHLIKKRKQEILLRLRLQNFMRILGMQVLHQQEVEIICRIQNLPLTSKHLSSNFDD